MNKLKTALWFVGAALALQLIFIFVVVLDPQGDPSNGWYHLVLWSMICTLAVWIVLHRERRQRRDRSLDLKR